VGFGNSTPLTRSWKDTLQTLLLSVGLLGLSLFLWFINGGVKAVIGAVVFALFGLVGLWTAATLCFTGDCPTCGAPQKRVGGLHRCNRCLAYGEAVNKEYCEIERDRVARSPVFDIPLPEQWSLPDLCCACGARATRFYNLRIIRKEFAFDLGAPHCELHSGGADLATEHSREKRKEIPILKVASYAFYREFLKINGMGQG
jgi:hypothetical protein